MLVLTNDGRYGVVTGDHLDGVQVLLMGKPWQFCSDETGTVIGRLAEEIHDLRSKVTTIQEAERAISRAERVRRAGETMAHSLQIRIDDYQDRLNQATDEGDKIVCQSMIISLKQMIRSWRSANRED